MTNVASQLFGFEGKKVVITGASSGMGAAATKILLDLGAEVYALDIKETDLPVKKFIQVNLGDKQSIDNAVKELPESIDNIFSCAGVAGRIYAGRNFTYEEVMTINFIGPKYLIESLLPRLKEGSAISIIASVGGMNWEKHIDLYSSLTRAKTFKEAQQWFRENEAEIIEMYPIGDPAYMASKEALILWMKQNAFTLSERKIRINTVSPGATQTPMTDDFNRISEGIASTTISKVGRPATPEDQAKVLVFLGSNLASYVSGQDIQVDYGYLPSRLYGFD